MKVKRGKSSLRQIAYARRAWGAAQQTKRQIALDVGYTHNVANSVVSKIESRPGYHLAMAQLAADSNNLALSVMHEIKARGFTDFSNKDLISAMNAIGGAWNIFNKAQRDMENPPDNGKNKLRTVILQNIEKQTINTDPSTQIQSPAKEATPREAVVIPEELKDVNLDF